MFLWAKLLPVMLLACMHAFPQGVAAQDTSCTYDSCALRLSGREVRRGVADKRVDGFSFFGGAPELPMLVGRTDSAGINFEAFRRLNSRAAWLNRVAMVTTLGGVIVTVVDAEEYAGWGIGLTFVSFVPLMLGSASWRRALDRLQRAIWWYNRDF